MDRISLFLGLLFKLSQLYPYSRNQGNVFFFTIKSSTSSTLTDLLQVLIIKLHKTAITGVHSHDILISQGLAQVISLPSTEGKTELEMFLEELEAIS